MTSTPTIDVQMLQAGLRIHGLGIAALPHGYVQGRRYMTNIRNKRLKGIDIRLSALHIRHTSKDDTAFLPRFQPEGGLGDTESRRRGTNLGYVIKRDDAQRVRVPRASYVVTPRAALHL